MREGWGEGAGGETGTSTLIFAEPTFLHLSHPAHCPSEQDGEALAVGNFSEHPRPGLGLGAELWSLDLFVARETRVSPRKETTALWLLRHPLQNNEFPPKVIPPETVKSAASCLLPEPAEMTENEICP